MAFKVTVQENGRVVLPAAFRRALGHGRGERHQLVLDIVDGQCVICTESDQVRSLQSRFQRLRKDEEAADSLARTRRSEAARED